MPWRKYVQQRDSEAVQSDRGESLHKIQSRLGRRGLPPVAPNSQYATGQLVMLPGQWDWWDSRSLSGGCGHSALQVQLPWETRSPAWQEREWPSRLWRPRITRKWRKLGRR